MTDASGSRADAPAPPVRHGGGRSGRSSPGAPPRMSSAVRRPHRLVPRRRSALRARRAVHRRRPWRAPWPWEYVLGAVTLGALWLWTTRLSPGDRAQVWLCVVVATAFEYLGSQVWGAYRYRFIGIPAFVPFGHGLVYVFAFGVAATAVGAPARAAVHARRARPRDGVGDRGRRPAGRRHRPGRRPRPAVAADLRVLFILCSSPRRALSIELGSQLRARA